MKEIIKKLQQDETRFTINGITNYKGESRIFKVHSTQHDNGMSTTAIYEDRLFGNGMNVSKFGPTCVWLFDYDMFGRKSTFKINYKDVTIIEESESDEAMVDRFEQEDFDKRDIGF